MSVVFRADVVCDQCGTRCRVLYAHDEMNVIVDRDTKQGERIPVRMGAPAEGWSHSTFRHHCAACTKELGRPLL